MSSLKLSRADFIFRFDKRKSSPHFSVDCLLAELKPPFWQNSSEREIATFGCQKNDSLSKTDQGCQMVYFQTKNPNLGKFLSALDWKVSIYFMAIWNIIQTFGKIYDHLAHFVFIWYIFPVLVSFTKKNLATLKPMKGADAPRRVFFSIRNFFFHWTN
jgi:hypothetical protein